MFLLYPLQAKMKEKNDAMKVGFQPIKRKTRRKNISLQYQVIFSLDLNYSIISYDIRFFAYVLYEYIFHIALIYSCLPMFFTAKLIMKMLGCFHFEIASWLYKHFHAAHLRERKFYSCKFNPNRYLV